MNHVSLHSIVLSSFYDFAQQPPSQNPYDPELLQECISLALNYPKMVWPYFSNIKVTIETHDSPKCRNLTANGVEAKISFILKHLERSTIPS